jgi:hypothetical protein
MVKHPMPRDIDQIIESLETQMPGVEVTQLKVGHPGVDDDGVWFIRVPGRREEVQVESPDGNCPFLIESDFNNEQVRARTTDEVVSILRRFYA